MTIINDKLQKSLFFSCFFYAFAKTYTPSQTLSDQDLRCLLTESMEHIKLTVTTLCDKMAIVFMIFFPRKPDLTFHAYSLHSIRDNLHGMSNPVF